MGRCQHKTLEQTKDPGLWQCRECKQIFELTLRPITVPLREREHE